MRTAGIGVGLGLVLGLTTAAAVAAQEPSATPAGAWTGVAAPVFADLEALEQVVSIGAEVVAIGSRCDREGTCERLVLTTPDGTTWSERGVLPADVDRVADLVADGTDLYIVGDDAEADAAIWRSADAGGTWQRVGDPDAFTPGADGRPLRGAIEGPYDITTLALARGPAGLIAGGWSNGPALDRSAIWQSTDGTAWERVRLPREMDRAGGVFDVAATELAYVATTAEGPWRSTDGRHWTPGVTKDGAVGVITDVEPTDAGFIGLGIDGSTATTWIAPTDGSAWRPLADDEALDGIWEAELRTVGPRVVAVGTRDGDERIPTAWLLAGEAWSEETIPATPGAVPADVAAIGDDLIVIGTAPATDGRPAGAAWRRVDATGSSVP